MQKPLKINDMSEQDLREHLRFLDSHISVLKLAVDATKGCFGEGLYRSCLNHHMRKRRQVRKALERKECA